MTETASSSSSTPKWTYDVFLSFRGEDVRKNFVGFLYTALQQKGIYTFKDDERLERGCSISPALSKAIQESRIAVVIFSENYASSTWCLEELVKIMECKNLMGQTVVPVFYYVEPSVVRKQKESFGKDFDRHEAEFEDNERVKRWRAALVEAANLSGWDVSNTAHGHESKCIQQIVEDIMAKLGNAVLTSTEDQVGIESQVQRVNSLLNLGMNDVRFVGIWGMSGIGKTTLARAIFDKISDHFEGASFLLEVRENSNRRGLENMQERLLSEILKLTDLKIHNVYEGMNMIKRRLCYKRVLIVLDDIDNQDQLDELAGKHDWFGAGSRVIITTKNKHLLVKHKVDRMYKVEMLSDNEGMQLFSRKAFKRDNPVKDYLMLSQQIVHYAGGLPLALKVLGSFLCGRDIVEWRSEVERLKRIPEDEILEKLKVSFNGLKDIEKEIFLDIACFFNGRKKDSVARILDSFNFYADIGIRVLIEKSLLAVSRGRLLMHQLIQEMGWHIVYKKAPEETGKRSRLWVAEDICHLFTRNMGTVNIEGIWLDFSTPKGIRVNKEAFKTMHKLRLLKIHNACVSEGPDYIPNEMRWLNWHGYPSTMLPASFQAEKLVGLKMKHSRLVQLWKGVKILDKLKFINLSHSEKLIRTPDFTWIPNLESLILEDCASLVEIHPSAGFLKKLQLLSLKDCKNLRKLPRSILLANLKVFILSGCSKLNEFPEILGTMKCLLEVYLEATAMKDLPSSIGNLSGLVLLNLSYCKNLTGLPKSIGRLKCLKALMLSGCSKLDKLPEELGHVQSLEKLHVDETAILQPPTSIVLLKNLKTLSFRGVYQIESAFLSPWLFLSRYQGLMGLVFPSVSGLNALVKLDLSDCNILDGGLPCDLGSLSSLEELNLGRNNFMSISAASINRLHRLRILELVGCKKLQTLPVLPSSIEEVYADDCTSLHSDTDQLLKYERLYRVSFTNCAKLLQNEASSMVDAIWQHLLKGLLVVDDNFSICLPGRDIPNWFTYQNRGPSISIRLPPNWYNDKFMGFALCVISDLIITSTSVIVAYLQKNSVAYLKKIPSIPILFKFIAQDGRSFIYGSTICTIGAEKYVDSEHICLAYLSFDQIWEAYQNSFYSPNEWCQIEVSAIDCEIIVFRAWGFRLVFAEDVKQNDERSMIRQSSESKKLGLCNALFNGSEYIRKKRQGWAHFSRLPPEIMSDDFRDKSERFNMHHSTIHPPIITLHLDGLARITIHLPTKGLNQTHLKFSSCTTIIEILHECRKTQLALP